MPKIIKKTINKSTENEFLSKYNIPFLISENDAIRSFYTRLLNKNESINNSHIYVKWANYIFNNYRDSSCPIKECIKCPSRWLHMNYAAKKFGFKSKEEFFKNRYDKRWNIIRHVPNNKLEKLFKDFIEDLHNQPKSTGNKRAKSSITTYISQIKKWEKDLNKLIGSSFELTLDVKKTLSKKFNEIVILESTMLNKIMDCVLNESMWRNKIIHSRIRSMFFLMIQTGLRQSELINLNISDYNNGILLVRGKKNSRKIALNENSKKYLDEYLNIRFDSDKALFVSQDFNRITKSSVENGWKRISERVGIHFSSIDLRKTSAVLFAKSGATASELKEVYGFRTKQIAQKYFNEGNERRLLEKQMNFKPI
tara:strand:- start:108 stop:1208 length:1101 start_codon:yes stop_codon:yes gene_type:complete